MYKDYNDYELLDLASEQNEEALNIIYNKYSPLVNKIAKKMLNYCHGTGIELNDLIQEGMLGLTKAIQTFKDSKEALFYTYANTCIENKIISAVVATKRLKHRILNTSISYETFNEMGEYTLLEPFLSDNTINPETLILTEENKNEINDLIEKELTPFEMQVFSLKINGFNYHEIADILDKEDKSIDNALQRIKNKLKKINKEK